MHIIQFSTGLLRSASLSISTENKYSIFFLNSLIIWNVYASDLAETPSWPFTPWVLIMLRRLESFRQLFLRTHRIIRKWSWMIVRTSFFSAVHFLMDVQCFCCSVQSLIIIFPGVRFDVCSLQARSVGIFIHRLSSSTLVRAEAWLAAWYSSSGHAHHLHINRVKGNHVKRGKRFELLQLFDVECL